ncbi:bifunctional riboflavin kinase/FAD synthetase [Aliarcobacter butzleri]|uniref:bifunctional riboflavin kinase/FAD synthetase n=1 Tax=Aliarcobacter butzleri TaxID=28197 RepID=UPI001EDEE8DB|nr:bifunctional riboflavin kinase/FAD synthetase [Aliarcobacter butzleri]MCG3675028.1 bifunctional riboflavin kinase/FAD synthetase [Aliarcobacter butzleri]MCG3697974.1 bifunctional riboflavin kinase/FAD synthetase [Aliarcobacter butzleri]MCG3699519.1 bifunctional riboflavin kinase/FAD synthetase [Aliarcobacter butzleri]MCT7620438.1 bifunctional riboflavin kinase/FAD synthetase [Aliarcobacter butzleri]MDN5080468.1 bifunctional riboflavin kinase/FAD synthetase [Aliarcobacter butzleri]
MLKSSSILVNKNTITAIAIGGFDGMHIAHQELFKNLGENGAIVSIESGFANLTPKSYRQEYSKYPIYYYVLDNIKKLEGVEFIKLLKEEFPKLEKIVVGYDFCFGKNRSCSTQDLEKLFDGEVIIIPEIKVDNIAVHSRTIREFIKDGNIELANKLLGKEYKIYGFLQKGQGLGTTNFVPTINLTIDEFLLPKEGIYISKTIVDEIEYSSVSFLGHRATTDGNYAVETHILDKNIEVNNHNIQIKFIKRVRDNQKFDSFEELKKQILDDIEISKNYFSLIK